MENETISEQDYKDELIARLLVSENLLETQVQQADQVRRDLVGVLVVALMELNDGVFTIGQDVLASLPASVGLNAETDPDTGATTVTVVGWDGENGETDESGTD